MVLALVASSPAQTDGRFPILFENKTGDYPDSRIFIYGLGMDAAGRWCRFLPDGSMKPIDRADADAPGHLTIGGTRYANYAFPLSQAGTFRMAPHIRGGRIYISLGAPMAFPIGDNAWGGPDLHNPADPNDTLIYDWYELTYVHGAVPFGGNTTQVDQFGFPMTARLKQDAIGYDVTTGITLSREEIFSRYAAEVAAPFRPLAGPRRIIAPRSSKLFAPGGDGENLLKDAIDAFWSRYAGEDFAMKRLNVTFAGRVENGRLRFTRAPGGVDGGGPFHLDKPTTADVFACNGALARDGMRTSELELGAEMCAAFNRGVALEPTHWYVPARYYAAGAGNDFSRFFHAVGISGRAYAFAYDDVNDQSSVKILPNANPPTSLTLTVGPMRKTTALRPLAPRSRHGSPDIPAFLLDGRKAARRGMMPLFQRL